ncbi:MAG TPA: barstar family protein [Fimbriimonadaceae bacterium]|nr:barstar family protein [Fimbriimonadaceae bacterium]
MMKPFRKLQTTGRDKAQDIIDEFQGSGTTIVNVDASTCKTIVCAIDKIAEALDAPDYFGRNLDALVDIANDRPTGETCYVIRGLEALQPSDRERLLGALAARSEVEYQYGEGYAYFLVLC